MPEQDERIYREFEGRIGRAVSQLFRHVEGEGIDATPLEGAVTLRIEGGRLAAIEYPALKKGGKAHVATFSAPEIDFSRADQTAADARATALTADGDEDNGSQ